MQDRRILSGIVKENEIPSSATAWYGDTLQSESGNVLYLPLQQFNSYILDSQYENAPNSTYMNNNEVEFPTSILYGNENTSWLGCLSIVVEGVGGSPTGHVVLFGDGGAYLYNASSKEPHLSNFTNYIDYNINSLRFYRSYKKLNRSVVYYTNWFLCNNATQLGNTNDTVYVPADGKPSLIPHTSYIYDTSTYLLYGYNMVVNFADGWVKLKLTKTAHVEIPRTINGQTNLSGHAPMGRWIYPIYVDNEPVE